MEPGRPRGRRPAGSDTRGQILAAARDEFAERGFEGASVRAIARRAGVDPALVRHYFADKTDLFAASIIPPGAEPPRVAERIAGDGLEGLGGRLLTEVLTLWGADDGVRFRAAVGMMAGSSGRPEAFVRFLVRTVFNRVLDLLPRDEGLLRVELAASQVMGLLAVRYVLRAEPLASLSVPELVRLAGPTVDRYLTGPLPGSP